MKTKLSVQTIPFLTQSLEITAWFTSDEGVILGPVEPFQAALAQANDGVWLFVIRFWFSLSNGSARVLHGENATISIAGDHRQQRLSRLVCKPRETIQIAYDLKCNFNEN